MTQELSSDKRPTGKQKENAQFNTNFFFNTREEEEDGC